MQDPFPISPIPLLQTLITPICDRLHFYTLPNHIHEILILAAFYHFIFAYLAPPLSSLFLNSRYTSLSHESRLRWNMHCASMAQSLIVTTSSLYVTYMDDERRNMNLTERMWGYTGAAGMVQAFATGYFLFDLVVMLRYRSVFGLGMLAHATACVGTYMLGFRPVFNYYGCVFVLYELSTPFLNIHWFCDKLGMTGSRLQLYNGLCLILVFFLCRLVWGAYSSINIYTDVWNSRASWGSDNGAHMGQSREKLYMGGSGQGMMGFGSDQSIPYWVLGIYGVGHVVLQLLNVFWFWKMIKAVLVRFRVAKEKVG